MRPSHPRRPAVQDACPASAAQAVGALTDPQLEKTFAAVYARLAHKVRRQLAHRVDWDTADDITDAVFVELWQQWVEVCHYDEARLKRLVACIVRRRLTNVWRERARARRCRDALAAQLAARGDPLNGADRALDAAELKAVVEWIVESMPPRIRETYVRARMEGVRDHASADKRDRTLLTVRTYLMRATRLLHAGLKQHDYAVPRTLHRGGHRGSINDV